MAKNKPSMYSILLWEAIDMICKSLFLGLMVLASPLAAATISPVAFTSSEGFETIGDDFSQRIGSNFSASAQVSTFQVHASTQDTLGGDVSFVSAGILDLFSFNTNASINYHIGQRQTLDFGGPDGEAMGLAWAAVADVTNKPFAGRNDLNFFDPLSNPNGTKFDFIGSRTAVGGSIDQFGFFTEGLEPGVYSRDRSITNVIEAKAGRTYAVKLFTWVLGDGGSASSSADLHFDLPDGVTMSRVEPVPLPAGVWLVLSGVLALFGISRGRKVI